MSEPTTISGIHNDTFWVAQVDDSGSITRLETAPAWGGDDSVFSADADALQVEHGIVIEADTVIPYGTPEQVLNGSATKI